MQNVVIRAIERLDFRTKEAYKTLRTNLSFAGKNVKVISLTSCTPNEGKTSVSFQLCLSLAESGKQTILVDADLRKSVLRGRYKANREKYGLSHYLSGQVELDDACCRTNVNNFDIIFAGRFIPLKHPEYMIRLAADLKKLWEEGQSKEDTEAAFPQVLIHMAGSGQMEEELRQMAKDLQVEEEVIFYGFQSPAAVRDRMEQSHIMVFPSNHLEGWGAVVNEAMNSGCAVVACEQAGAVPYLIKNGENGFIFKKDYKELLQEVTELVKNPELRLRMAKAANETITTCWNAKRAALELLRVIKEVQKSGKLVPAKEGPLSRA